MSGPYEYYRVPTRVEAWLVTEDKLPEIAKWCKGKAKGSTITFTKIRDKSKPLGNQDRHSYAIVGEYIVRTAAGFLVMKPNQFDKEYRLANKRE